MIYAMSDIHGQYGLFVKRVEQIRPLLVGNNKLVLLGDYIDRGDWSYECLKLAYDLEQELGRDKVIALKGNHEVWFEEFLFLNEDVWLAEDKYFVTSGTFLTDEQLKELGSLSNRDSKIDYVKKCITEEHKELLSWMRNLRLFYEDKGFRDIFYDGESHYYIDGSTAKFKRILCLAYDEATRKYYQLEEDGTLRDIRKKTYCHYIPYLS